MEFNKKIVEEKTGWDRMIATKTYGLIEPDPYVVEKLNLFKKWGIKKVFDLGCGQGRHTLSLSKAGFQTFALDISPHAIATTESALAKEKALGNVTVGDMKNIDFPDDFFDSVLAWRVLYLEKRDGVKKSFAEVRRIIRPGGILYASIRSSNNTLCHIGRLKGEEIEPNTFLMNSDVLSGIVYHFFTPEEVADYLSGFEILELEELELQHTEYTARYPEYRNLFWVVLAKKL